MKTIKIKDKKIKDEKNAESYNNEGRIPYFHFLIN